MDLKDFSKYMEEKAAEVEAAINTTITNMVESDALRFIDDNFRNQSWEGQAWKPSKGTILVKSGALRRGFNAVSSPGIIRIVNAIPYALPHNTGFNGNVVVKEHNRAYYSKKGRKKTKKGTLKVKSHKRHMRIPQRQYAPYAGHESPTLNATVHNTIQTQILKIITP